MSLGNNRVLLIGVDGIGLSDLKHYQLKKFLSALHNGASGKISCSGPLPTVAAWAGLATGCSPDQHGILGPTILDQSSGKIRAVGPCDWNHKPIWEILEQEGLLTNRFNIPGRHPEAEQDHCLSISPVFFNQIKHSQLSPLRSVQPANFFDAAKSLAVAPAQMDQATLKLFIPDLGYPDLNNQPAIGEIAGCIASNLSIQAIAGQAMAELDWDLTIIRFSLADEINEILKTTNDPDGFFGNVREAAFRTLNLCLGTIRRLAGDHILILYSAKGEGGGFIAFDGEGIRSREKLLGPRHEDIAPTLLNLMGLSAAEHMNGRVLEEMFAATPQTEPCPPLPDSGTLETPTRTESGWLLEPAKLNTASWRVERFANQQKATAYLVRSRWFEALPFLLEQHISAPLSLEFALPLCQALFHSGLIKESSELMKRTAEIHSDAPITPLLKAMVAHHSGNSETAVKHLETLNRDLTLPPDWKHFLAEVYLNLDQPGTALQLLNELLEEYADHVPSLISKSEMLATLGQANKAADAARRAIESDFSSMRAHLALSRALLLQGRKARARTAVVTALRFCPESPIALSALAASIEEEDPWGAEMIRARASVSNADRQLESQRWQYQLFVQDAQRKMQLGQARLIHSDEVIRFCKNHQLPHGHMEQTEVIVTDSEAALLRKPMLENEPARVEFFQPPSAELQQGILERCRRLGIQTLRTWSLLQTGSPLFQRLENQGFKHWMQINRYQINGPSVFAQMRPLVDRIPLPENGTIVPLNHVSWEAVRLFIIRHIPVSDDLLGPEGYRHISADLSFIALQNKQITGVFINRIKDDVVHCPYLAVAPEHRNRWVVPHLFKAVAKAGTERGYAEMEFMTHPKHFPAMFTLLQRLEPKSETLFQGLEILVA
ncbi:alkaline phosphatase family protein [Pontiellaceae bacterium B12219]|nr:alkaline phosphatase family protein [Pontiellaceae bacterium B12219]